MDTCERELALRRFDSPGYVCRTQPPCVFRRLGWRPRPPPTGIVVQGCRGFVANRLCRSKACYLLHGRGRVQTGSVGDLATSTASGLILDRHPPVEFAGQAGTRSDKLYGGARHAAMSKRCPNCGSGSVAEILYGYMDVSGEVKRALDEGRATMGGCCIEPDAPSQSCNECQHLW